MTQDKSIFYQQYGNHCFQQTSDYSFECECNTGVPFNTAYLSYDGGKQFISKAGKCSDGPSNPFQLIGSPDKKKIRPAWGHDCLYWAIRERLLPPSVKHLADKMFKRHMIEDGVDIVEVEEYFLAVEGFGKYSLEGGNPILEAP